MSNEYTITSSTPYVWSINSKTPSQVAKQMIRETEQHDSECVGHCPDWFQVIYIGMTPYDFANLSKKKRKAALRRAKERYEYELTVLLTRAQDIWNLK